MKSECSYYHDQDERTVYAVPSEPTVVLNKSGWHIWTQWEVTRADNVLLCKSNRWKCPLREYVQDWYDNLKDTEAEAIRWFMLNHQPPGVGIDAGTYLRLKQQYESEAEGNQSFTGNE